MGYGPFKSRKPLIFILFPLILVFIFGFYTLKTQKQFSQKLKERLAPYQGSFSSVFWSPKGWQVKDLNLSLKLDQDASLRVSIDTVILNSSLESHPHWHLKINQAHLVNPQVQLSAPLKTNWTDFFKSRKTKNAIQTSSPTKRVSLAPDLKITWNNGESDWLQQEWLFSKNLQGWLTLKNLKPTDFKVQGQLRSSSGSFTISLTNKESHQAKIEFAQLQLQPFQHLLSPLFPVHDQTHISGKIEIPFSERKTNTLRLNLDLDHFAIHHWRLAEKPISDINLHIEGLIDLNSTEKQMTLKNLKWGTQQTFFTVNGNLIYKKNPQFDFRVQLPTTPIQDVFNIIPKSFIPKIYDAKIQGDMSIDLHLAVDWSKPHKLIFDPQIDIQDFKLLQTPAAANIPSLKHPFLHTAYKKGMTIKEFTVGRKNRRYVSYGNLGPTLIRGVLTCEDGRFFRHNGFQLKHFRESLIQNIKEKRFARGASTITMQLAKNLFLNGRKNISRKFQEILLAYALEQELDKKRLLEIYMNIIEWGPKIYGIGHASRHYFNKSPSKLTQIEAAFLGSIIANPVKYHSMYRKGEITHHWETYLSTIVSLMKLPYESKKEMDPRFLEFGWERKKRLAKEKETELLSKSKKRKKRRRNHASAE